MLRRELLLMGAGFALPALARRRASAAEQVVLGVVGVRGRGRSLAAGFAALPDARVKTLCDVDSGVVAELQANVERIQKSRPGVERDFRKLLDDPEIDAVVIATPDHWHALITIMACLAGKDVYVEKPCSHNVAEGLRMIQAAERTGRVVQVGTQRRSAPDFQRAVEVLRAGKIGRVLQAKALNSQRRANIGKKPDGPVPSGVDYDLWLGPAPARPFNPNRFHYNWHWFWDYGTGDLGNDGVHHVDVARWGLGVGAPTRVTSTGGKYHFDDDQETPDTQTVVYEFPGCTLTYEMRLWSPYGEQGMENGNVFYGDQGYMVLGDRGYRIHAERDRLVEEVKFTGRGDVEHLRGFVDCVRTRKRPACDVTEGHLSAALCHLGNISHRVGRPLRVEGPEMRIAGDAEASRLLTRRYRKPWELPRVPGEDKP